MASEHELELEQKVAELTEQLEQARNSQAGSDRTVTELKQKIADLETASSADDKETELAAREKLLEMRKEELELAAGAVKDGLDPGLAFKIIGLDGSDAADRLKALAEHTESTKQAETERLLKAGGRHPHETVRLQTEPLTLAEINKLSDAEINALSGETVNAALDKAIAEAKGKRTLRQEIAADLVGGRG